MIEIDLTSGEWEQLTPEKVKVKKGDQKLTNEIARYVVANLGIIEKRRVGIHHDAFLSDRTLSYLENGEKRSVSVWACETTVSGKKLELVSAQIEGEVFVLVRL